MKFNSITSLLLIMGLITWGCNENAPAESEVQNIEEVSKSAPGQSLEKKEVTPIKVDKAAEIDASGVVNAAGEPDAFGRQPGDEHYGHSHGPQGNQTNSPQIAPSGTAAPANGPDAYGRQPGEEHYGHSHD